MKISNPSRRTASIPTTASTVATRRAPAPRDTHARASRFADTFESAPARARATAVPPPPAPTIEARKAERMVGDLYQALLGRAPDPEGLAGYRTLVEQGFLPAVVRGIAESPEHKERNIAPEALAKDLYRALLRREPDPEGENATREAIERGGLSDRVLDMVTSNEYEEVLSKPEPEPTPAPTPVPGPGPGIPAAKRTGLVGLSGSSFKDDQGEFNALGATFMSAAWMYKNDRPRLEKQLEDLSKNGFDYIRALGVVGWPDSPDYWDGREIDWRDPEYKATIAGLTDLAYDKYGLRTEWTLIGDGQKNIPNEADRFKLADTFLEMSRGREAKIMHFEVANEAYQNGFPDGGGADQLRRLTKYMNDRTDVLVSSSAPPGGSQEDMDAYYKGGVADLATIHFDRDTSKADGNWRPVRQPWEYQYYTGMPKGATSNEPIGPGSSVNSENDPKKLVSAAIVSYLSGVSGYVYHTKAGVRGDVDLNTMPGMDAFRAMKQYVPSDLANWTRKNGHWSDSPFRPYAKDGNGNLVGDRMWPDLGGGATGAVRTYGAVKGDEFFVFPMGIKGGVTLEPRRNVQFDVIDPMTGRVVDQKRLNAGEKFELAGEEIFVLKGRFV